jgi:predicted AAA+ superfamily ATPase
MNSIRANESFLTASIERNAVTTILGSRRVGKTYFLSEYQKAYSDRLWILFNMDILRERERVEAQELNSMIIEKAGQHIGEGEKIWVVIDEAQKCPTLFEQIKVLYDQYKDQSAIKFILTGSAMLSLHQQSAESLAGRIELIHMHEFTLHEAVRLKNPKFQKTSVLDALKNLDPSQSNPSAGYESFFDDLKKIVRSFEPFKSVLEETLQEYLVFGGFPEVLSMKNDDEKNIYLDQYLQTYLEKDIRAIENITNLPLYRNLLNVLAEQTGSTRDESKMISALGCTRDTLKKYRALVEATFLYQEVYPLIGKTLRRLVKSPKGYLLNNGLVSVLTGIMDLALLEKTGWIGHRLENAFLNELRVWLARQVGRSEICFWQTTSQAEVDFVVVKKPYLYPFEVTYQTEINRAKVRNLKAFLDDEPEASFGFYIYRGEFQIDRENRIIFLPYWAIG